MRISDVLAALQLEFPTVTPSKLRFLEEQGLITPVRTASGYRQYSSADVERLRYILREQRDRYTPLKVIGEQLARLDAGDDNAPVTKARLATSGGAVASEPARDAASVATQAGVDERLISTLVEAGVLRTDASGHLDPWAVDIARAAHRLGEHGLDVRHLRQWRNAADRQVGLVEQSVAPLRGTSGGGTRADELAAELGEVCAALHQAMVRSGIAALS